MTSNFGRYLLSEDVSKPRYRLIVSLSEWNITIPTTDVVGNGDVPKLLPYAEATLAPNQRYRFVLTHSGGEPAEAHQSPNLKTTNDRAQKEKV